MTKMKYFRIFQFHVGKKGGKIQNYFLYSTQFLKAFYPLPVVFIQSLQ